MNIQISGNLSGPTAIFIAGWPDTSDVFRENIMATLAADYRIVGITLPGFDDGHPFLQSLRKKGLSSSFSCLHADSDASKQSSTSYLNGGSSWLPCGFPFPCFRSADSEARAAQAQNACLVNSIRISCGRPPLEMFRTTRKGHSLQDVVTMLEIAVDTAMETCNYCPSAIPSISTATTAMSSPTASSVQGRQNPEMARGSSRATVGETKNSEDGADGVPLHQLPPTYARPVLIAHDWGCALAYELLLMRPNLFSRIVALDVGAYAYESAGPHVERMCELVCRSEKSCAAPFSSFAARAPRASGTNFSPTPEQIAPLSVNSAKVPIRRPSVRDSTGETSYTFVKGTRRFQESKRLAEILSVSHDGKEAAELFKCGTKTPPAFPRQHSHNSDSNSQQETPISSPVTVPHTAEQGTFSSNNSQSGLSNAIARPGMLPSSVSITSQPHNSVSSPTTKRSLASQYAIRRKKPTHQTQQAERWKRLVIAFYQLSLIACTLFLPFRLARWIIGCFATLIRRPSYCYDPQVVSSPTVELLNHTLNAQFFAQHPYAVENRAAFDLPMLLQIQGGANVGCRLVEPSFSSTGAEHSSLVRGKPSARLLPGWKIMLIPYVEGSPVPVDATQKRDKSATFGNQISENGRFFTGASGKVYAPRSRIAPAPTHSDRHPRFSRYSDSNTSTDFSQDDMPSPLQSLNQEGPGFSVGNDKSPTVASDANYTIYSSYTKGASLFEELNAPVEGLGRASVDVGSSGELDPYLSALVIPNPLWAAEDPLTLTGAHSFREHGRWGTNGNKNPFLIAADRDGVARRGAAIAAATTTSASPMQVKKRKIFYQAVAFPPPPSPMNASSSFNGETNNVNSLVNSDDATSSRSTHSTMLDRLRRSHRRAALRPSVPVVASPRQGWIYLRYWLGTLLLMLMAFTSWLFGERKPTQSSGAVEGGSNSDNNHTKKAYSNVMTTAMTTIYRRLPATPSLAASTANLPGDGDVVLQPKGFSPLISQRYFVPLTVPILFMYGGEKKVMAHADHWCAYIRQFQRPRDGISDVVEVQGGGHWFFAEKKYQKKVADRIAEFLAAEQKSSLGL